jgi:hypothetical protein
MALSLPDGPQDAYDCIADTLGNSQLALRGLTGISYSVTKPLRLYNLRIDDINSKDPLASARAVAWRYILLSAPGDVPVATIDVQDVATRGTSALLSRVHEYFWGVRHSCHVGPIIKGSLASLMTNATRLAEVRFGGIGAEYEPRVLEIPELYAVTIWLHGTEQGWVIPLEEEMASEVQEEKIFANHINALAMQSRGHAQTMQR